MVEISMRKMRRESVTQRETIDVAKLERLDILTSGADVKVLIHDKPRIDIVFETYEGGPHLTTKNNNDGVEIMVKEPSNRMAFSFNKSPCNLQLSVPNDIAANWNVKTNSGDISAANLLADSLNIKLSSGDLDLTSIMAGKASIETTSGDISVQHFKVDELHFEASSGRVHLVEGVGDITGMTSSGDVIVKNLQGKKFEVVTSSGSIKADHFNTEHIMAKASSGDIELDDFSGSVKGYTSSGDVLLSPINECAIDMVTGSGDVTVLSRKKFLNAKVDISTGSGDIMINLPMDVHNHTGKGFEGIIGEGKTRIRLNSGSGDVKVF